MSTMKPIERFDPKLRGGKLLEAEHLARYRWAAALVEGKRVLDAGCGTGYGADLLGHAGASAVIGVDIDEEAVRAAKKASSGAATFMTADLRELPADLGAFDVVVCFEVLEHIDDPEIALDSLAGALRANGILVASSPNKDVYPPGNPYHRHEFRPDELAGALAARFANVRLVRQQDWLAVGIFEDGDFALLDSLPVPVAKAVGGEPGQELYTLGLASRSPLPPTPPFVLLTQTADVKWWQELLQGLRDELEATRRHARELEERYAELEGVIESMKATRVWRIGTRWWSLKARLGGRRQAP